MDLGSPSVGLGSNPDSISVVVFGADLGQVYFGSFAERQSFAGGCAFAPVVDYPSAELAVSEVMVSRELENQVGSRFDFPPMPTLATLLFG